MRDLVCKKLFSGRALIAGVFITVSMALSAPLALAQETTSAEPNTDAMIPSPADDTAEILLPLDEAAPETTDETGVDPNIDPWESFNRKMFALNIFLDDNFMTPVAKGYRATTPPIARRGIRKFLANVRSPGIFVNDLLQGEFKRAGTTLSRFVINSTLGAGGFADPAAGLGLEKHSEDFGQTLAVWGLPSGPYTVLPFFGPGTVRSGAGSIGQIALNPLVYIQTDAAEIARYTQAGVGLVSTREQFLDPIQDIRDNSLDYYSSMRSFYLQNRAQQIANGETDEDAFDEFESFEEFEDFDDFEDSEEDFGDEDF